ncbi:MAG: hypothetical protein HYW27_03765, partial [Candidatus Aenigmarchaeota archaeon]|nr:hypothetical protein [Candidatus Aenigmarchaeota archaeon]
MKPTGSTPNTFPEKGKKMNYIVAMLAVLVAAFANGTAADSLEELEAQIRKHQSTIDSLQSRLYFIRLNEKRLEASQRQEDMEKFLSSV